MRHEVLDHVLVAKPVTASDGVVEMIVEAVIAAGDSGPSAFGRHGVAAHGNDFGDERDAEPWVALGCGDRGAQSRSAATHDHDIGLNRLHPFPFF